MQRPPTPIALTATLALAGASWVVAIRQMNGMDMGVATRLGSFAFFVALWVSMMAAMMLPGAVPAVLRRASGRLRAVPLRQLCAMVSDMGSGKISSSPFSTPSKMARATDSGEAFGMSKPRVISVSVGPVRTA